MSADRAASNDHYESVTCANNPPALGCSLARSLATIYTILNDVKISLLLHHFGKPGEDVDGMTSSGDALRRQVRRSTDIVYGKAYLFSSLRRGRD